MKGLEGCSWYQGQQTETCLAALYIGLNVVSAVGVGVNNMMMYLC